jgi:hypothetical protein
MVDSLNPENSCRRWAPSLQSCLSISTMTYGNSGMVEIKDYAIRACKLKWRVISVSLCFLHFNVVSANVISCLLILLFHNHIDWLYCQVQCSAVFTTSLTPTTNDNIWRLTVPSHWDTAW